MLVLACNPTHLEQENSFSAQGQSRVPRKILYQKQKQNGKTKIPKLKKKKQEIQDYPDGKNNQQITEKPTLRILTFESLRQGVM